MFDRVSRRIDGFRDLAIALETDLTALPAISPRSGGRGEARKASYILELLSRIGVTDVTRIDSDDPEAETGKRPNIIARIPGADPSRTLWIMTHMDVVPPGDESKWSSRIAGTSTEHGNPAWSAPTAGWPPSPAILQVGGGASVVVGARESRAHGEGRQ